ncbi:MAG: PH domain-containing protein [Alphaproteobacteria bacterium]|nr:PH domain-containing protein [Alphaproteobacteria bacterium]
MTHYVNQTLMPSEHIIYVARLHRSIYISGLVYFLYAAALAVFGNYVAQLILRTQVPGFVHTLIMLVAVATAAIGAFDLIFTFLRHISTELVVTNQRVIIKYGFFGAQVYDVLLAKVTGVDIEQTTLGRWEGCGTVTISATASHIPPIDHVADPFHFQSIVMQYHVPPFAGAEIKELKLSPVLSQDKPPLLESGSKEKPEG